MSERAGLLCATASVLVGLWWTMVHAAQVDARARAEAVVQEARQEIERMQRALAQEDSRSAEDLSRALREARERLRAARARVVERNRQAMSPGDMQRWLRQVLAQQQGRLRIDALETLPAEQMLPDDVGVMLWRHGIRVEFEGTWHAALDYLSAIERSPWLIYWNALELTAKEWPVARFALTLYTISVDPGLISPPEDSSGGERP